MGKNDLKYCKTITDTTEILELLTNISATKISVFQKQQQFFQSQPTNWSPRRSGLPKIVMTPLNRTTLPIQHYII